MSAVEAMNSFVSDNPDKREFLTELQRENPSFIRLKNLCVHNISTVANYLNGFNYTEKQTITVLILAAELDKDFGPFQRVFIGEDKDSSYVYIWRYDNKYIYDINKQDQTGRVSKTSLIVNFNNKHFFGQAFRPYMIKDAIEKIGYDVYFIPNAQPQ